MNLSEFLKNQIWSLSGYIFALSVIVFVCLSLVRNNKRRHTITPNRALFIGVFLSAFAYFMPIYFAKKVTGWTAFWASIQHSFRIFALDGDFKDFIFNHSKYPKGVSRRWYTVYGAFLYAFAPLLTFGFILTFFKNFFAHLKYKSFSFLHTHVFSELNEKSLALADSISKNNGKFLGFIPRVLIVFTDIIDKKEELHLDLVEEARAMGAILFRKDLESVNFKISWSWRKVDFYLISDDESEKIRHAESIMKNYDYDGVNLWIFSDDIRTELMLEKNKVKNMNNLTRVNDIQTLIYHNLYENGVKLFERCREIEGEKVISAVIIGLGKYGQEMLKALTWYCQLGDYKLKINAFDADEKAREKFVANCPELMSEKYNKAVIDGEPYYEIDIHNGIDVSVPDFEDKLKQIKDATYIFICLGDDKTNLEVASKISTLCEHINYDGDGRKPVIETVIYDSNIKEKLGKNWKDIEENDKKNIEEPNRNKERYEYKILMTGDLTEFYSQKTLIDSKLVEAGFGVHRFWTVEPEKISFTVEYMEEEWREFVKEKGLEKTWEIWYCGCKNENERIKKENEKKTEEEKEELLRFSDMINGFSFMKAEEMKEKKELQNTDNKKELEELKDTIAKRSHEWEKQVYAKFKKLMDTQKYYDEWKQIETAKISEAKKDFRFEYNYRSSIAKAIHKRLREKMGFMPEITNKPWEDMTWDDKVQIGKIEHVRWNAYMRTEGYSYAPKRNDLARLHHNLVPVGKLSNDDLRKDA